MFVLAILLLSRMTYVSSSSGLPCTYKFHAQFNAHYLLPLTLQVEYMRLINPTSLNPTYGHLKSCQRSYQTSLRANTPATAKALVQGKRQGGAASLWPSGFEWLYQTPGAFTTESFTEAGSSSWIGE